jgi:hypothetical protein
VPTERVIEIPWALAQLPQAGLILDVGSCDASYLRDIIQIDRQLHCLDPRPCAGDIPPQAQYFQQSIIGNTLPRNAYDAVLVLSVIEHIGLPCYEQPPFPKGDLSALRAIRPLLKPGAPVIVTLPAGQSKIMSWYRQYSPENIRYLFLGWRFSVQYWGFDGSRYIPIAENVVEKYDYRDQHTIYAGAGAVAGIVAFAS